MIPEYLQHDQWLSGHMGKECYMLKAQKLLDTEANQVFKNWLNHQPQPCFIFTKVDTKELIAINNLEAAGFKLVDTNVTFVKDVSRADGLSVTQAILVDRAQSNDQRAVEEVAHDSFIYSRFHLDPLIPNEVANAIKKEWVSNYFIGKRGQNMVVAKVNDKVAGFVQLLELDNTFIIDLIAVSAQFRGMGVAARMISFCFDYYSHFSKGKVGTQVANSASINLYIKCGYRLESSKYIFHYHKD